MSRPTDSTHFTSTSPHASRKPPSSNTTASPAPPNETPREKVARLRAAHHAAKARASYSFTDTLISRGRAIADASHRVAAYTLIGFTGVSAVVAVYGLGSLISHNRRQKRAWIEREMGRLDDARAAFLKGAASAEQLHLLEMERAGEEMEERVRRGKAEGGWFGNFKKKVWGAAGREDEDGEYGRVRSREEVDGVGVGEKRLLDVSGDEGTGLKRENLGVFEAVKEHVKAAKKDGERILEESPRGMRGGPLDVLAGNVAGAITPSRSSGWFGWGKSS